jgi:hypothetical protein
VEAAGRFTAQAQAGRPWSFELAGQGKGMTVDAPFLQLENGLLFLGQPDFLVSGHGEEDGMELQYELVAAASRFVRQETQARSGELRAEGRARLVGGERATAVVALQVEEAALAAGAVRLFWPRTTIAGRLERENHEMAVALVMKGADGRLELNDLTAAGVTLELPLSWPPTTAVSPQARLAINSLRWRDLEMGTLTGTGLQQGKTILVDALHVNRQIDGLQLHLAGRLGLDEKNPVELELAIPAFQMPGVDLGLFSAAAEGMTAGGRITGRGRLAADWSGPEGSLLVNWKEGTLRSQTRDLLVEGIETDLNLIDLLALASAPGQQLRFGRAALGGLILEQGSVDFQMEKAGSLLIEKSSFPWSDGVVRVHDLRITPGMDEYNLVLHGDGLRIAAILRQLGLARAEGEGRVSGMIPLRIGKGKIRFGNGFLVSDPGQGGTLKVKEAQNLAAAIPGASPEFSQLDFALEALRDFEYNWVRLFVEGEGENMALRLQLDGRPAKPLPFVFRRDLGSFIRIEGESEAGITQPLRLDINFRLPFDELLHYGAGIHGLWNN